MTAGDTHKFDSVSPIDVGFLADDFGIIFPSDHGFSMRSQTNGVSCHQLRFSGTFLSMGHPKINRGFPDWMPNPDGGIPKGETHPVADVDLSTIPEHDYETLPEWVKERGHFYNWNEFGQWLDQDDVWRHSWIDLIDELQKWNHAPEGIEGLEHSPDMTERWDSLGDIWNAIDDVLSFTYDVYDYDWQDYEAEHPWDDTNLPGPTEGIRWITLTGSKTNSRGEPLAPWAETLKGEHVILSFPNSD